MLGGERCLQAARRLPEEGEQEMGLESARYVLVARRMLRMLQSERVGDRPGRCEPRAVKGRPKPHKLLKEPRKKARARLLNGKGRKKKGGKK